MHLHLLSEKIQSGDYVYFYVQYCTYCIKETQ